MRRKLNPRDDRGIAMLSTIMVLVVLVALGTIGAVTVTATLQTTHRDLSATSGFFTSEAGVAQAVDYLRSHGVKTINSCYTTQGASPCPFAFDATNGVNMGQVVTSTGTYTYYIKPTTMLNIPTSHTGIYRVHSIGNRADGTLQVTDTDLQVRVYPFAFGVYVSQQMSQGNGVNATTESVFSASCVNKRANISLTGTDAFYGIPAAVHAAGYITTSKNGCSATDSGDIHKSTKCNSSYPADQDALGAAVTSPCNPPGAQTPSNSCNFPASPSTSAFSASDLACYNPNPRGLPQAEYDQLKATAIAQSSYFTSGAYTQPDSTLYPNGVLYIDLTNSSSKSVSLNSVTGYPTSACGTKSLIIIVLGGDATINAGTSIVGSIFVPDGSLKFNGNATVIGTMYAKNMDTGGGASSISLQTCYTQNLPATLLDISALHFHQADR
jgi:Tfp pilus assembly protein PilX